MGGWVGSDWIRVTAVPADIDLGRLSRYLYQQQVPHRVTEEVGQQVLWVDRAEHAEPLRQLLRRFIAGDFAINGAMDGDAVAADRQRRPWPLLARSWGRFPLTLGCLLLSIGGWLITYLKGAGIDWQQYLVYTQRGLVQDGEIWRLVTPIFLHFGIFHLVFNGLWLWVLGTRLEAFMGSWRLLGLIGVAAVVSNTAQYLWSSAITFGGMSGVVYALVGFIWLRQRLAPVPSLALPGGYIGVMLFWLVLCMSGVVTWVANVGIANAAHLFGLLVGVLAGTVSARRHRRRM